MRVAELLSDLTSLRACVRLLPQAYATSSNNAQDTTAALNLVSLRPSTANTPQTFNADRDTALSTVASNDVDLKRAKDLLTLHETVTVAQRSNGGLDRELVALRGQVERVLAGV